MRNRGSLASHRLKVMKTRRKAAAALTVSWDTAEEVTDRRKVGIPQFHKIPEDPTPTNELCRLTVGVLQRYAPYQNHMQYLVHEN